MVGRLVPVKNHRAALLAFQKLRIRNPHACLLIVGDGPLKQALQAYCKELDLSYSGEASFSEPGAPVVFTSWQKNMPEVMAALDIMMLTSHSEGTPLCVMEAMAAGKPVVSFKVGGVPEMIDHVVDGMLVEQGDLEGLVDALDLLASDSLCAQNMGSRARMKAVSLFDKQLGLKRVEELISSSYIS
jgi:glycosyltransferase involved in cell wall biosynthesis